MFLTPMTLTMDPSKNWSWHSDAATKTVRINLDLSLESHFLVNLASLHHRMYLDCGITTGPGSAVTATTSHCEQEKFEALGGVAALSVSDKYTGILISG